MASVYQEARQLGQDALHTAILDRAISLLTTEGPSALAMRRIAAEIGASTKVVHTMFGGKPGLVDALYREGFARLQRAQDEVPKDRGPREYLNALGAVYRERALAEPAYYRLMFEQPIPGYQPGPESLAVADSAFDHVVDAVRSCIEAGIFAPGDAYEISKVFWAAIHGAVSLEIAGHFPKDKALQRYRTLMSAVSKSFLADSTQT